MSFPVNRILQYMNMALMIKYYCNTKGYVIKSNLNFIVLICVQFNFKKSNKKYGGIIHEKVIIINTCSCYGFRYDSMQQLRLCFKCFIKYSSNIISR